ncbi:MAG: ComEC/Rec2 family competence protein [Candidatus Paceibacterota bacterium]|jgi:competence protein ComEC
MTIGNKAFWFCVFFILGVFLFEIKLEFSYVLIVGLATILALIFLYLYKSDKYLLIIAVIFPIIFIGFLYGQWFEHKNFDSKEFVSGTEIMLTGKVSSYPQVKSNSQSFILKSDDLILSAITSVSEKISYDDYVEMSGKIEPLNDKNQYFKKDLVVGTVFFPKIIKIENPSSKSIRLRLFGIRDKFSSVLEKVFDSSKSALSSGMILGQESVYFPQKLKDAMRKSGTSHIVALSGYNIVILVNAIYLISGYIIKRKKAFIPTLLIILSFVLMTGAESSVVRAAIMGFMVVLAQNSSRIFSFKNAIAVTAFFMILLNPKIILFDIGFVLSFLALMGIVYISPMINSLFNFSRDFLNRLKNIFSETLSAQLAVIPILLYYFGGFSPLGIVANLIILLFVPWIMMLSFILAVLGVLSIKLAGVISILIFPILWFCEKIIYAFSSFGFFSGSLNPFFYFLYYVVIIYFARRHYKKSQDDYFYYHGL